MVVKDEREMMRVALERGETCNVESAEERFEVECATFLRVAAERDDVWRIFAKHIHRCPKRLSAT